MDIDSIRRQLATVHAERARAGQSVQRIQAAAAEELERVNRQLEELRPRAIMDPEAGARYQELTLQRGKLQQVLSDKS